jgi:hypothetical protein
VPDGGAVPVVVLVVGVVVVASVVEVELVVDDAPALFSGPGSTEVDVVIGAVDESTVLTGVLSASEEPVSGPATPATVNPPPARTESTVRMIRLRAVITPPYRYFGHLRSAVFACGRSATGRGFAARRRSAAGWRPTARRPTAPGGCTEVAAALALGALEGGAARVDALGVEHRAFARGVCGR